jgi:hypothetical protein
MWRGGGGSSIALFNFVYFYLYLYLMLVEWTTEMCRGDIILKERIVFGRCICVDWNIIDYFKLMSVMPQKTSLFKIVTECVSFYVICNVAKVTGLAQTVE